MLHQNPNQKSDLQAQVLCSLKASSLLTNDWSLWAGVPLSEVNSLISQNRISPRAFGGEEEGMFISKQRSLYPEYTVWPMSEV